MRLVHLEKMKSLLYIIVFGRRSYMSIELSWVLLIVGRCSRSTESAPGFTAGQSPRARTARER